MTCGHFGPRDAPVLEGELNPPPHALCRVHSGQLYAGVHQPIFCMSSALLQYMELSQIAIVIVP